MYLSLYSTILPVILGVFYFKKLDRTFKLLTLFVLVSLILEVCTYILFMQGRNNMFLYHSYTFVEFLFLTFVFYTIRPNRVLVILLILFFIVGVGLIYSLKIDLKLLDTWQRLLSGSLILTMCFNYFIFQMKEGARFFLEYDPKFLLVSGLTLYFLGTVLSFTTANLLIGKQNSIPWIVHSILNTILNVIYSIAIWKNTSQSKQ